MSSSLCLKFVSFIQVNRPGMSGDSTSWEGWSHGRWFNEEVSAFLTAASTLKSVGSHREILKRVVRIYNIFGRWLQLSPS